MIKKMASISLLIFTFGCLYFMSKGAVGITAAYFLIIFNIVRVFLEIYAAKLIADRLDIKQSIREEIPRKVGHMLVCFITYPMIYFSFKGTIHMSLFILFALIFLLIAQPLGILDIMKREVSDDNISAIKYLAIGALILSIISYLNPDFLIPTALGVMSLGLGDPMACFVGKTFGKHKIVGNKTLEGVIGFIIGATIAMYIFSGISLLKLIPIAICGAITELYSNKYDNALIQIVVCLAAYIII